MATTISVTSITAVPPIDIYVGDAYGSFVYYSTSTTTNNFTINVPAPYDTLSLLGVKIVDSLGSVGIQNEIPPSQTPTASITATPSQTPTNTMTPSPTNPTQQINILKFDSSQIGEGPFYGGSIIGVSFSNLYLLQGENVRTDNLYDNQNQGPPQQNKLIITAVEANEFKIRTIYPPDEQYGVEISSGVFIHQLKNYGGSLVSLYGITASGVTSNSNEWVWTGNSISTNKNDYYQLDQGTVIENPYNTTYPGTNNIWFTASTPYQPRIVVKCNEPGETRLIYNQDLSSYNNGDVIQITGLPGCYEFDNSLTSANQAIDIGGETITPVGGCGDPSC